VPGASVSRLSSSFSRRLERPIAGEALHGLPPLVLRLDARSRWEAPASVVPERIACDWERTPRAPRRQARPEPNAPQLIRIVKTPYAMGRGYFRRMSLRQARPVREGVRRPAVLAMVRQALERPARRSVTSLRTRARFPRIPRGLCDRLAQSRMTAVRHPGERA